eukprot:CAMPEP_0178419498 /NCGR_PEP_ID=MMETSP0689_2-20121128/25641_1 /TAXON_ID=160604 /ORGANISM="Amphidinium massartii, Strain CS-259" /LENGTH=49 /DNA_ID= /DNA_START= /DNA_END= /DNA_ORIENTATION=
MGKCEAGLIHSREYNVFVLLQDRIGMQKSIAVLLHEGQHPLFVCPQGCI